MIGPSRSNKKTYDEEQKDCTTVGKSKGKEKGKAKKGFSKIIHEKKISNIESFHLLEKNPKNCICNYCGSNINAIQIMTRLSI